jgi:hypothetical protein
MPIAPATLSVIALGQPTGVSRILPNVDGSHYLETND